jgi:hydrogenase maturation protease
MPDLRGQLEECLQGRVCLMGLGNVDYGDDGLGVRLAEELLQAGIPDVIIAATTPERSLGRVSTEGFDHVVFLDAVEFGGAPGSAIFLNSAGMTSRFPQISTHKIALGTLAQWAEASGTTKAWLLGVQPLSLKPAQQLTPTVQTTLTAVCELLGSVRSQQPQRTRTFQAVAELNV